MNNLDKILFVLSYMSKGDINSWKEEFFDTAEQKAMFVLGTSKVLIDQIKKDSPPYNAPKLPKDAIYEMEEMKMGNATIE